MRRSPTTLAVILVPAVVALLAVGSHPALAQPSYLYILDGSSPSQAAHGYQLNEILEVEGGGVQSAGGVLPIHLSLPPGVIVDALSAGRDDGDTSHSVLLFSVTPIGGSPPAWQYGASAKSEISLEPPAEAAADLFEVAFRSSAALSWSLSRTLSQRKAIDENGLSSPTKGLNNIGTGCTFNLSETLGLLGQVGSPSTSLTAQFDDVIAFDQCPRTELSTPTVLYFSIDGPYPGSTGCGGDFTPGDILKWDSLTGAVSLFACHSDLGLGAGANIDGLSIKGEEHPSVGAGGTIEVYYSLDDPSAQAIDPSYSGGDVWQVLVQVSASGLPVEVVPGTAPGRWMSHSNLGLERGAEVDGFTTIDPLPWLGRPLTVDFDLDPTDGTATVSWLNDSSAEATTIRRDFLQVVEAPFPGQSGTFVETVPAADRGRVRIYEISPMAREAVGFPHFGVHVPDPGPHPPMLQLLPPVITTSGTPPALWNVQLSWSNLPGPPPEKVEILRDGLSIATLPGTAVDYTDGGMLPGVYLYELVGFRPGGIVGSAATMPVYLHSGAQTIHGVDHAIVPPTPFAIDITFHQDTPQTTHEFFIDAMTTPALTAGPLGPTSPGSPHTVSLTLPSGGIHRVRVRSSSPGSSPALPVDIQVSVPFNGILFGPPLETANDVCVALVDQAVEAVTPGGGAGQPPVEVDCDTVTLNWQNPAIPIGAIEVWRDGALIAQLSPVIDSFTEPGVPLGAHLYELRTVHPTLPGQTSPPVRLEAVVTCGATDLIWSPADSAGGDIDSAAALETALNANGRAPVVLERIDDLAPQRFLEMQGGRGLWALLGTFPDNHVLTAAEGQRLADLASGSLDPALGALPVYIEGADLWGFDPPGPFTPLDGVANGTALDGDDSFTDMVGLDSGVGLDLSGGAWDATYSQDQAGNDWTDRIEPASTDAGGPDAGAIWGDVTSVFVTGIFYGSSFAPVISQSWELGGYGGDGIALVGIYLTALGLPPPPPCSPPSGLSAGSDCESGEITLSWINGDIYSSIDIDRDGAVIATLPGSAQSYADPGVAEGSHQYTVRATCVGGATAQATVVVTHVIYDGSSDLILALEGLQTAGDLGLIDSAAALEAALTAAGRTVQVLALSPEDFACLDQAEIVWVATGTFPDEYRITLEEGDALAAANAAGAGIYFEGGDHWGFAHVDSLLDERDGVDHLLADDGDDSFTGMDGLDTGLGLDLSVYEDIPYNQDQAGNDWTDRLEVATADPGVDEAAAAWELDGALGPPYITTVAARAIVGGDFIASSWEFGGFGGDQQDLAAVYAAFLSPSPPPDLFIRGDVNANGVMNIADPVFLLSVLFVPGAPQPTCDDAADANDDGSVNIADAISILQALFVPGTPPLPAPHPGCGTDPTADPLDCAAFAACP